MMQTLARDLDAKRSLHQHLTLRSGDEPRFLSRRSSVSSSAGSTTSESSALSASTSTPLSIHSDGDYQQEHDLQIPHNVFPKSLPILTSTTAQLLSTQAVTQDVSQGFKVPSLDGLKKQDTFYTDLPLRPNPTSTACSEGEAVQVAQSDPRRTISAHTRVKPSLVRSDERRTNYVDHLIDITEQLVAFIWPASRSVVNMPVRTGHSPIDLRFFLREILRRSRSSHSTLQVAMYYCFLVWKSGRMPQIDGRRMFLASLMLAYKYLQDRNFSTHAWKSISNLSTTEIKVIEIAFLKAVDYNLFIRPADWNAWRCTIDLCGSYAMKHMPCPWDIVLHNMIDIQKSDGGVSQVTADARPIELDQLASVACNVKSLRLGIITPPSSPENNSENQESSPSTLSICKDSPSRGLTPPLSQELPRTISAPSAPVISPLTSPDSVVEHSTYSSVMIDTPDRRAPWNASAPTSPSTLTRVFSSDVTIPKSTAQTVCLVSQVSGDLPAEDTESDDSPEQAYSWMEDNYELAEEHEEHIDRFLDNRSKRTSHVRRKRSIRTTGDDSLPRRKIPRRKA